jgi:hypothetical protein
VGGLAGLALVAVVEQVGSVVVPLGGVDVFT